MAVPVFFGSKNAGGCPVVWWLVEIRNGQRGREESGEGGERVEKGRL